MTAKGRILVVDDQPEIVAAFGLYFSEKGFQVRGAGSSREALALVEKEKFDVIFLDNNMPGGPGSRRSPGCPASPRRRSS